MPLTISKFVDLCFYVWYDAISASLHLLFVSLLHVHFLMHIHFAPFVCPYEYFN